MPDSDPAALASKQVVLPELSDPWEDQMEEAQERQKAEMVAGCWRSGWKAHCEQTEAGSGGFYIGSPDSEGSAECTGQEP